MLHLVPKSVQYLSRVDLEWNKYDISQNTPSFGRIIKIKNLDLPSCQRTCYIHTVVAPHLNKPHVKHSMRNHDQRGYEATTEFIHYTQKVFISTNFSPFLLVEVAKLLYLLLWRETKVSKIKTASRQLGGKQMKRKPKAAKQTVDAGAFRSGASGLNFGLMLVRMS